MWGLWGEERWIWKSPYAKVKCSSMQDISIQGIGAEDSNRSEERLVTHYHQDRKVFRHPSTFHSLQDGATDEPQGNPGWLSTADQERQAHCRSGSR